ncbi:uridine kinase [Legionella waltersii]|uniref:uridine/cytidine kinase n=1 Tax=Legionella waltersii TaxID=66969 RepID=A0A0W1A783_9GAMM|nr:uridine kinase [Legionella waltersii]KTD77172.1 uridine kinase [Legionella waltersii]SNV11348.1 uridine kinase [Legionella waltersii]
MPFVVGVAGCSGSGKSTVSALVEKHYQQDCVVLSADNYYLGKDKMKVSSFDHPDALDFELLISHVQQLKLGKSIEMPDYDFTVSKRKEKTITVHPKSVIIIEGILVLHPEKLRALMDVSVFVDTDIEKCRDRRVARDILHRGRKEEHALEQWNKDVLPSYYEFVEPSKRHATLLLENSENNEKLDFEIGPVLDDLDNVRSGNKSATEGRRKYSLFKQVTVGHSVSGQKVEVEQFSFQ